MNPGRMNRRVSILLPTATAGNRSTDGEPIMGFTTLLSSVWADRVPISGRELYRDDKRYSDVTRRYILRLSTAVTVTPSCQLTDHGDSSSVWDVRAVVDVMNREQYHELLCAKVT